MDLTQEEIKNLEIKANEIRKSIIEMLVSAGSGHTAGSLGMADIFSALYFNILKHKSSDPHWPERDRLVLSNGHICPVLYSAMAHAGYFSVAELKTLRKLGSRLQGHPHREWLSALETSSGPLGEGLSQAVGMALAERIDKEKSKKFFYCILGDGELDEGSNWEATMLAGKEKLHNLIAIIDRNNIQIDGFTENVMPIDSLRAKWEAWNWHVLEIDGHNFNEIISAVDQAKSVLNKPSVIIAHTIPGKGVKEFEGKYEWHGKAPNKDEAKRALEELDKIEEILKK